MGAILLEGHLVVKDIEQWCLRKGRRGRIDPVLAVVFFNTDPAAEQYIRIKAHVAEKAGVGYWVYEISPEASSAHVQRQIQELNENEQVHGILIQRPLPEHLNEPKIMASIDPDKHIEEYCEGQPSNIAADALCRLLSKHGRSRVLCESVVHVVGFGIITDGFTSHMRHHYPRVSVSPNLPKVTGDAKPGSEHVDRPAVLITELHRGPGFIKPRMIRPDVRVIIDLGFYSTEQGVIVGDLDHTVFEKDELAVAPTPGGVLPVLPWLMMERTIRAKRLLTRKESRFCCLCQ
ncbi:Methylenetetrahydrofolate dehydrogenase (NADP(+)) [Metarhizium anisopliae]